MKLQTIRNGSGNTLSTPKSELMTVLGFISSLSLRFYVLYKRIFGKNLLCMKVEYNFSAYLPPRNVFYTRQERNPDIVNKNPWREYSKADFLSSVTTTC
jgi:hypothetical protein